MSAVADELREARALIERGWTQNANARNRDGLDLDDADPATVADCTPVCWCAGGAMWEVAAYSDWHTLTRLFCQATGEPYVPDWNDAPERTQAEVLAAFDKAIQLAEGEQ